MPSLTCEAAVESLVLPGSNSLVRVAIPFDVAPPVASSHHIGPLERSVLTFERQHGPLPLRPDIYGRVFMVESNYRNQKIPGVRIDARLSLMDPHEGKDSQKSIQLMKEQCHALDRLARLYGSQFALWSPFDDDHGTRLRMYLTEQTKIFNDNLYPVTLKEAALTGRGAVFSCRLHKVNYTWGEKSFSECVLEVMKLYVLSEVSAGSGDEGDDVDGLWRCG
ncbi:hypothetical protein PM082_009169 [Marasmius tenuissimus]|nr:hypothetical protein PM082_009169 [Marasmius tenuissimus]